MTELSDEIITSEEQAVRVKADLKVDEPLKTWKVLRFNSGELATHFANASPAQQAGEAVFSVRDSGLVDGFLFY
jgi:hypothetical protein